MRHTIALAVLFIVVLGGGYIAYGRMSSSPVTIAPTPTTVAPASGSYTAAQVAEHDNAQDCWSTIGGNVYDLTQWIDQHPGGEAPILGICGKDGTEAFMGQHADDARANAMLATFKIGTLAN